LRYLPLTPADRAAMLERIGAGSIADLFIDVPEAARLTGPIEGLASHRSELAVERMLTAMAARNMSAGAHPFFLGAGAYRHHVPATVDHLIQRGEFLTSYTPYQPEIAQGTLQYLFEFQTQVARLFAMDVANASMYDGSTALTEAIFMARRITGRTATLISGGVHPHYVSTARTLSRFTGDRLRIRPPLMRPEAPGDDIADLIAAIDGDTSAVVVQHPNFFGHLADLSALADAAHGRGALLIVVVTEVVALGAVAAPGEMGADIVVGEGQSIGNGLNFGGPYLGLFACRQSHVRQMPGRLCGETVDAEGRRGYVLTLSTREQHIRREKATSNICTNAGLCSLAFSIHLALLGQKGLGQLAAVNHARAVEAADRLAAINGVSVLNGPFFNEFTVDLGVPARAAVQKMAARGVLGGVSLARLYPERPEFERLLLVAVTETVDRTDIDALAEAIMEVRA
jgi:glycine dehydrogenase subunit 1